MMILLQSSFHATRASLFEMDVKPSSLDRNGNELEHEQELEFKKHTKMCTESSTGDTSNTLQFIWPICPNRTIIWYIFEKSSHDMSSVHAANVNIELYFTALL